MHSVLYSGTTSISKYYLKYNRINSAQDWRSDHAEFSYSNKASYLQLLPSCFHQLGPLESEKNAGAYSAFGELLCLVHWFESSYCSGYIFTYAYVYAHLYYLAYVLELNIDLQLLQSVTVYMMLNYSVTITLFFILKHIVRVSKQEYM